MPDGLKSVGIRKTNQAMPEGFDRVRQLYIDFFRALYAHIEKTLEASVSLRLAYDAEFVFTMPPTWDASTSYHFRNIVRDAGFTSFNGRPSAIVLHTEAEAVVGAVLNDLQERSLVSIVP
jgi:hypothetical protein